MQRVAMNHAKKVRISSKFAKNRLPQMCFPFEFARLESVNYSEKCTRWKTKVTAFATSISQMPAHSDRKSKAC